MSSRIPSTVLLALVLSAASIIAAQRAPAPVTNVRITKNEPVIWGVTSTAVTSSQATVNWTTDVSSDSLVEYGLTTSYGSMTTRNTTLVTAHTMTITGLLGSNLYHFRVRSRDAAGIEGVSKDYTFMTSAPATILWAADHEEGSLSDWYFNDPGSGEALSGTNSSAASQDVAHSGLWSAKATIWTPPYAAVRLFRKARTNPDPNTYAYYSAWYYVPLKMISANFQNIFAYKSVSSSGSSDPFFSIYIGVRSNGNMYLTLGWWCGLTVEGPHQGESGCRNYQQTLKDVPVAKWFHVETYLRQSDIFTGQIIVWQDGVEIFNENNIKTRYSASANDWLIANYGDNVVPSPFTIYFDDAAISSGRIGPGGTPPSSSFAIGDRIQTLNGTNVRGSASLSGTLLGTQPTGALGTIISGPIFADGYTWWQIDYDNGADGWSGENNYTKVTTPPPTAPVISAVMASAVTSSQATVTWTTDLSSDSLVEYGLTTSYGTTTTPNTTLVTAHTMTIAGLLDSHLYHFRVRSRDANGIEGVSSDYTFTTAPSSAPVILWTADHEEGNMSDWYIGSGGGEFNSGGGVSAASRDVAHTGAWSAKGTIGSGVSAIRLFRWNESHSNVQAYYSAWYYFPQKITSSVWGNNVFQFKSKTGSGVSDPFWDMNVRLRSNGNMYLTLNWWCGLTVEGPHLGESGCRTYQQTLKDLPVAQWVHIEAFLRQSPDFGGQIIVWQDGTEIFNQDNVRTRYQTVNGWGPNDWSINNYGENMLPTPFTMYFDDAVVSLTRVGPGGTAPSSFAIGDRIQTLNATNVRASGSLSGTLLGTQATGALGTIIAGPVFADGYTWWNIDYDNGADGWSGENNYTKVPTPPPTPSPSPIGQ